MAIFLAHGYITRNNQIHSLKFFSDFKDVIGNLSEASYSLLFILCGFLNTWGLFEERFIYKKVNLLKLYMRRILSILPLYLVVFVIGFFIIPSVKTGFESSENHGISIWNYLSMTGNFFYTGSNNPVALVTGIMWSVAISFQFVVVWPILMNIFRRNEIWLFVFGTIIFVFSAWYFRDNLKGFRFNTLNILFEFMVGSWIAYFSFFKYRLYDYLKNNTTRTILAVYLIFFALIFFRSRILFNLQGIPEFVIFISQRVAFVGLLGYFIFEQNFSNKSLVKLSKLKVFNFAGKLSYGLYSYHMVGILFGYKAMLWLNEGKEYLASVLLIEPFFALATTIGLALISNEFFEKKFTRRKKNYLPNKEYNPIGLKDVKTKSA